MKVISGAGKIKRKFRNAVLAIGVFDGLHRGHQMLIRKAIARAKAIHGDVLVMTFMPHPLMVLHPEIHLSYIISLPHRLKLIEALGVSECIVVRFTKRFARLTPQKFVQRYLARFQPLEIFVGGDFRFGQDRSGDLDYFQEAGAEYGFRVNVVRAVKGRGKKIGSSMIRRLIPDGKLAQAARLLGRPVSVMGQVVKGAGRGKRLGFPTANISVEDLVIPPSGVYAVKIFVNGKVFPGMANIGRRPSFETRDRITIEAHLFNFSGNLYRRQIIVEFVKKIREEKLFFSESELIVQLRKDQIKVRNILRPFHKAGTISAGIKSESLV